MAYPLASIWISNGYCKSIRDNTGVALTFSFNVSKTLCFFPPNWNTCFTLVNACKGVFINEKLVINFLQYYTAPKTLQTFVAMFGLGQFTITFTLEGSILKWPFPRIEPKHIREVFPNSHFDILICNFSIINRANTFHTCIIWSFHV